MTTGEVNCSMNASDISECDEPPLMMAPSPPTDDTPSVEPVLLPLVPTSQSQSDPLMSTPVVCSVHDLSCEHAYNDRKDHSGDDEACAIGADVCSPYSPNTQSMDGLDLVLPLTPVLTSSRSYLSGLVMNPSKDSNKASTCEMCSNYEATLQQLQTTERNLKQQIGALQNQNERYRSELSRERTQRQELELSLGKLSAETKGQVEVLTQKLILISGDLKNAQMQNINIVSQLKSEMERSKEEVGSSHQRCDHLQTQLDNLLGWHKQGAADLQNQQIDLPQNVDDLQLMCLQLREELIETKAAKEHFQTCYSDQEGVWNERMKAEQSSGEQVQANMAEEINSLRTELGMAHSQCLELNLKATQADNLERQVNEFQVTIQDLEEKLKATQNERADTQLKYMELRQKSHNLQLELDNCETVQGDFVKLSQSLQIELEKIRQADREVRWQNDDDCYLCSHCKQPFTKHRTKIHCKHCGKIFCAECLKKSVASGPQRRPAKVCDVCHTLLARDTAPYFSNTVPST